MIILKLTGVFDHIRKKRDIFQLHVQYRVLKLQLSIQRNYNIFFFQVFLKDRSVFRTQSNIKDGAFCGNSQRLKAVNYFHE